MMINNIQVEDLVDDAADFTLEKKRKFIANCNSLVVEGNNIVHKMFRTIRSDVFSADISSYPQIVLDYPVASTLFVQLDGISFICHVLSGLACDVVSWKGPYSLIDRGNKDSHL